MSQGTSKMEATTPNKKNHVTMQVQDVDGTLPSSPPIFMEGSRGNQDGKTEGLEKMKVNMTEPIKKVPAKVDEGAVSWLSEPLSSKPISVKNARGTSILKYNDHSYYLTSSFKQGTAYFKCTRRHANGCPGGIILQKFNKNDWTFEGFRIGKSHNHGAEDAKEKRKKLKRKVKTNETLQNKKKVKAEEAIVQLDNQVENFEEHSAPAPSTSQVPMVHSQDRDWRPLYVPDSCTDSDSNGGDRLEESRIRSKKLLELAKQGKLTGYFLERRRQHKLRKLKRERDAARSKKICKTASSASSSAVQRSETKKRKNHRKD